MATHSIRDCGQTIDEGQILNPAVQPFVPRATSQSCHGRQAPSALSLPTPHFSGEQTGETGTSLLSPASHFSTCFLSDSVIPRDKSDLSENIAEGTGSIVGPDGLNGRYQADVHAAQSHSNQAEPRSIRSRKKQHFWLTMYVLSKQIR